MTQPPRDCGPDSRDNNNIAKNENLSIGFAALVFIFRVRSFKEVVAMGRADRAGEGAQPGV